MRLLFHFHHRPRSSLKPVQDSVAVLPDEGGGAVPVALVNVQVPPMFLLVVLVVLVFLFAFHDRDRKIRVIDARYILLTIIRSYLAAFSS
jgi:hypothetical protein